MEQDLVTLALTIAAQLPANDAEAVLVLGWVNVFRQAAADARCPQQSTKFEATSDHEVVLLRREGVGGSSVNSPSLRPSRMDSPSVLPK
jgi:hypothetical protein